MQPASNPLASLDQWDAWIDEQRELAKKAAASVGATGGDSGVSGASSAKKKKLSYKDQREFDGMEAKIHEAEEKLAALEIEIAKPENTSNAATLAKLSQEMQTMRTQIERMYARWAELESGT